jgi:hypothetical protein
VQRYPLRIEWAVNQAFEIDLFSLVDTLERWMRQRESSTTWLPEAPPRTKPTS